MLFDYIVVPDPQYTGKWLTICPMDMTTEGFDTEEAALTWAKAQVISHYPDPSDPDREEEHPAAVGRVVPA